MYGQAITLEFAEAVTSARRAAWLAALTARHAEFLDVQVDANRVTLVALRPDAWDDVLASALAADREGLARVVSQATQAL
jgi:hypothetical protein